MKFFKMQAMGNDFIITTEDEIKEYKANISKYVKKLCDRKFGIGADGLIFASKSVDADIKMNYYNADGSRAKMCGNGIRCLAKYMKKQFFFDKNEMDIETDDGIKKIFFDGDEVSVNMGEPQYILKEISGNEILNREIKILDKKFIFSMVEVGVPHIVILVDKIPDNDFVEKYGSILENHNFFPNKTNVNFIEILDEHNFKIKTFERGVGITLGCGTGCCASMSVLDKLSISNKYGNFISEGGELKIKIIDDKIIMTGEAFICFRGEI